MRCENTMTEDTKRINLKETLLMPKTNFPMKANLSVREPKMQEKWQEQDIEAKIKAKSKDKPRFILHDGPPYANGDLHMGHALNKILKDFIIRYRTLTGYNAPFIPGWDTHGLPIETALLKKEKINRKKLTKSEFRDRCRTYALKQVERQKEQFLRLGLRGDWNNPYITLDANYVAEQIGIFGKMAEKGYIYKGLKPVYWSPSSESALAEAEIEYQDKKSYSIYVAFNIVDGKNVIENGTEIIIWTTTPWTIPANVGIAVNPDVDYAVIKIADGRLQLVAASLLETLVPKLDWHGYQLVQTIKGRQLEYVQVKHPIYEKNVIVMCGQHVTTESGTGCVHTAPGHGEDDFLLGKAYDQEIFSVVDEKGIMNERAPMFTGMFYDDAAKEVVAVLTKNKQLVFVETITHSYPHDWRTKKPTIFRATSQWFASINDFREELLQAIEATSFTPHWGKKRLLNMVRDRGDWCISRQRAWGVPIPVFYGEDGSIIINQATIFHIQELFRAHGPNIWFEREAKDLLPTNFSHESSPNGIFTKEEDIMDVWFDSGSSHQAVLASLPELGCPADLYLEGSDQYRGWFNSSLATAVAVSGRAPYKHVLSHGFVLDGQGRKMSKSIGNTILPAQIAQKYGVDVMRLWVASVNYQADVRISDDIIKQVAELYRKIRNTFRFLLGNLADFKAEDSIMLSQLPPLHKFMLHKLNKCICNITAAYESNDFASVFQEINHFCTVELSAFYLDIAKDVLYCDAANSLNRRSFQTVFNQCLLDLVRVVAPILPHTADEIWANVHGVSEESVHLASWPQFAPAEMPVNLKEKWDKLFTMRCDVLKVLENARDAQKIGKSLNAKIILYIDDHKDSLLTNLGISLEQFLIVSKVEILPRQQLSPEATVFPNYAIVVSVADGDICERCWNINNEVCKSSFASLLCSRCTYVLAEMDN